MIKLFVSRIMDFQPNLSTLNFEFSAYIAPYFIYLPTVFLHNEHCVQQFVSVDTRHRSPIICVARACWVELSWVTKENDHTSPLLADSECATVNHRVPGRLENQRMKHSGQQTAKQFRKIVLTKLRFS